MFLCQIRQILAPLLQCFALCLLNLRRCDEHFISTFYVLNCKHISIPHAQLRTDFPGQLHSLRLSMSRQTKASLCCFISNPDRVCLNIQNTIFRLRITRQAAWLESRWSQSHASMWLQVTVLPECSLTSDCLEASLGLEAMLTCKQNVLTSVPLTFKPLCYKFILTGVRPTSLLSVVSSRASL